MTFKKDRYTAEFLPQPNEQVMAEFAKLPEDPYCGYNQRYRRFSQYKMYSNGEQWKLEKLPHRPFIQSKEYNSYIGGIPRYLEPLNIDPTPQIAVGADILGLETDEHYQINVHQCRVITNENIAGVSVPEGPHRDGHEWGMVAVFKRNNIIGGETQLFPNDRETIFYRTTLRENEAILYEDGDMRHFATDIISKTPEGGYRDLWIVAYNRWKNRRYGEAFEQRAKEDRQQ